LPFSFILVKQFHLLTDIIIGISLFVNSYLTEIRQYSVFLGNSVSNSEISLRLKLLREGLKLNLSEFARKLDIPRSTLVGYENGSTIPAELITSIASIFDVSISWLVSGQQENLPFAVPGESQKARKIAPLPGGGNGLTIETAPDSGGAPGSSSAAGKGTMKADAASRGRAGGIPLIYPGDERLREGVIIPFLEQSVSAGGGAELQDGDESYRYMKVPAYLSRYPDLAMLPVRGDSMDPTLHDGDMVVCDGGGWDGDGVYVIKTSDEAFVKRVLHTPDGYQVVSDNKLYPGYLTRSESLRIVGKVRAAVIQLPGRRGGV
jgi:transcriptional regulator with XRE-family HTH domain/SOS-response transcriptional repressor LexA